MFKTFKTVFKFALFLAFIALLQYNLPDRDIVRVVGTDVKRVDVKDGAFGWGEPDAGTEMRDNKDVRFIYTIKPKGNEMVYRNEDTGWGWPPYFKFDTSDLAAQSQDLANKADEEVWVAVKHYGWRIKMFSLFPNAVDIKQVDGPNVRLIPWFNIAFLTILFFSLFWIWLLWRGFRKKRIDPVTDKIDEKIDEAAEKIDAVTDAAGKEINESTSGLRKFMRKWFGSK